MHVDFLSSFCWNEQCTLARLRVSAGPVDQKSRVGADRHRQTHITCLTHTQTHSDSDNKLQNAPQNTYPRKFHWVNSVRSLEWKRWRWTMPTSSSQVCVYLWVHLSRVTGSGEYWQRIIPQRPSHTLWGSDGHKWRITWRKSFIYTFLYIQTDGTIFHY